MSPFAPPDDPQLFMRPRSTSVDCIIIGAGPIGLFTSYLLQGHTPTFASNDCILASKLYPFLSKHLSNDLYQSDWHILAQQLLYGYEATLSTPRSLNPIALLFDTLIRPDIDKRTINTAESAVVFDKMERGVSHVVLSESGVGGVWSSMLNDTTLALSATDQIDLPGWRFNEWYEERYGCTVEFDRPRRCDVAQYLVDYADKFGISKRTRVGCKVEVVEEMASVMARGWCACMPFDYNLLHGKDRTPVMCDVCAQHRYYVAASKENVWTIYATHAIILSNGLFQHPKQLPIQNSGISYSIKQMLHHALLSRQRGIADPVLVVGTGLTAADAILQLEAHDIPVVHVYRSHAAYYKRRIRHSGRYFYCESPIKTHGNSPSTYPEYHRVWQWMKHGHSSGKGRGNFSYSGIADGEITRIVGSQVGILQGDQLHTINVSAVGAFIGQSFKASLFSPHLSRRLFGNKHDEWQLGDAVPIDWTTGQVCDADDQAIPHLYAVGSLTGDTFIRFGIGSALAAARHVLYTIKQ